MTAGVCTWQIFYKWPRITYKVDFLVGHTLQDPLERIDAIHWWLGTGPYNLRTSAEQLAAWIKVTPLFRMMAPGMTEDEIDAAVMAVATP